MAVERDFIKQSHPSNLGYFPVLSCSIPFISSQMAILLMLAMVYPEN
jgi:hypothetical protein